MSNIAFFCIAAHGHTNPTLEVIKELHRLGHHVYYFLYTNMKEKIEACNATFISCDAYEPQSVSKDMDTNNIAVACEVLVDTTLALEAFLDEQILVIKPDVIVSDSMAIWGKAVALRHHIPYIISNTTFAFNKEVSASMKGSMKELFIFLKQLHQAKKHMKRLSSKGYPFSSPMDVMSCDETSETIVYTSAYFQPAAQSFSNHVHFVGPCVRNSTNTFEKTRKYLIYISMGTVVHEQKAFYQACVRALTNPDYQVVIVCPGDCTSIFVDGIDVHQHVNQIAVLKQADVFLTHCGMNSVNEALSFGVPLITHPITKEQERVAMRVEELQAGLRLETLDEESIKQAVSTILSNTNYHQQAKKIQENFNACYAVQDSVKLIENLCK